MRHSQFLPSHRHRRGHGPHLHRHWPSQGDIAQDTLQPCGRPLDKLYRDVPPFFLLIPVDRIMVQIFTKKMRFYYRMLNNKISLAEMLRDFKNCLPRFYAEEISGNFIVYNCKSHMILENHVSVIYLEKEAIIDAIVTVPKSTIDKITHITLARPVEKNIYSIYRWVYTNKALNVKPGSVPLLETGKSINIIEFR